MGKATGFLEFDRRDDSWVSEETRITNFDEFHNHLNEEERRCQAARCMDCGVPMCQSAICLKGMVTGCPLHNVIPEWNDEGTKMNEEMVLITQSLREVGQIMNTYVGIVRTDLRLKRAWDRLDLLYEETEELFKRSVISKEICELRNVINVGYLIMRWAMERKESRGLHYNLDHPRKD